jgi:hypothetical protein
VTSPKFPPPIPVFVAPAAVVPVLKVMVMLR